MELNKHPKLLWGAAIAVGGMLYLKVWLPATNLGVPCVFHEATGLYCSACGITRSVLSLLAFDAMQAFRYNPLPFVLLPMAAAYFYTNKKQMQRTSKGVLAAMLVATLAFGLLRNIPMFDFLAPTVVR